VRRNRPTNAASVGNRNREGSFAGIAGMLALTSAKSGDRLTWARDGSAAVGATTAADGISTGAVFMIRPMCTGP
jgi:hypothetical protein